MNKPVYIVNDHILSPLGTDSESNWDSLLKGKSGIAMIDPMFPAENKIYGARLSSVPQIDSEATKLENMFLFSLQTIISKANINPSQDRLLLILSTAKGNIDLLDDQTVAKDRIRMSAMALFLKNKLGLKHQPLIVSNACVSGLLAIQTATLYIKQGLVDHVIVSGGDLFSKFTLSGFYAFKALSAEICKPFDKHRDGINLGEGVGSLVLTASPKELKAAYHIEVSGVGSSNDANHISGPSRDGSGLALAIKKALKKTVVEKIDFINAHGTGTLYNDNMESLAFQGLGLSSVPLNSFKAYYGHTLGAAGVIETIIGIRSLLNSTIVKSLGYTESGTDGMVNVASETISEKMSCFLKTASGFGGCNAALMLKLV